MSPAPRALQIANLALWILFPLAWTAPVLRAGLLPWFGSDEISILSGIIALWGDAPALAIVVALFALVIPMVKTIALSADLAGRLPRRLRPALHLAARLAMADVFLAALYIVAAKGVGLGRVEPAWGLWLFTGCVLASLGLSLWRR